MAAASAASCLGPAAAAIQGQKLRQRSVRPGAGRGGGARQAPSAKAVAEAGPVARPNQAEWNSLGSVCAVLGSQWGDEGKGKLVDILAQVSALGGWACKTKTRARGKSSFPSIE